MQITIDTKTNIYKTIGYDEKFKPLLWFRIGERKLAIEELTNFYNKINDVMATGIEFNEEEWNKFSKQFEDKARAKAIETVNRVIGEERMYQDKFFTFLTY